MPECLDERGVHIFPDIEHAVFPRWRIESVIPRAVEIERSLPRTVNAKPGVVRNEERQPAL
jgi:hypothetical protein